MECINKEMCAECKGACCKRDGCCYIPEDFKSMKYEYLLNKIKEGNITLTLDIFNVHNTLELQEKYNIDYGNLWTYYLYLKARNINENIVDFSLISGRCKMLDDTGCKYTDDERPSWGLSVIPTKIGGVCKQPAKDYINIIRYDWIKYQDILEKIVFELTGKKSIDLLKEESYKNLIIRSYYNEIGNYILSKDAIESELNYKNINIDKDINVKKLILK